jgi:hypothetical protein
MCKALSFDPQCYKKKKKKKKEKQGFEGIYSGGTRFRRSGASHSD